MRVAFQQHEGRRGDFQGTVVRFGLKRAFKGPPLKTVLLKDVADTSGKIKTDHLWFTMGKQMKDLNLKAGDKIAFTARITSYEKGYKGHRAEFDEVPASTDYRLSFPTNVRKQIAETVDLPLFTHALLHG